MILKDYILSSPRTVFTLPGLLQATRELDAARMAKRINYYVRKKMLRNLHKGIYAKQNYKTEEIACSLYTPSYISLQYVLQRAGVIFQYDSKITSISYLSREILIDDTYYSYSKVKDCILVNRKGIENKGNINIASPERAFLDTVYLYPDFYFDNPSILDKDKILELLPLYMNKKMEIRVLKII